MPFSLPRLGKKTPDGYYNLATMLKGVVRHAGVLLCGTCLDSRGLDEHEMVGGAKRSTMRQLAQLAHAADKVLVF